MISLEQQVCSLALAKLLKELGVRQESYFVWIPVVKYSSPLELNAEMKTEQGWTVDHKVPPPHVERYTAFTVTELGFLLYQAFQRLPGTMITDPRGYFRRTWQKITGFEDEANNRAKLLIYLVKNKIITF
jgi:hypothetical protein